MQNAKPLITRFAPAPTGYLHLGHVLSAAYVWGVGRSLGAKVLLRIEDHDRQRSREEYDQAILEDLDWLGFVPDNLEKVDRQQNRLARYAEVADQLPTYRCQCSRKEIASKQRSNQQELLYPGTCREKGVLPSQEHGIRVRLPESSYSFQDRRHGPQSQQPANQCGDLLIYDRNGNYTYNFAVAVDDLDQGVNLIIRGDDLFACTGRQLALHSLLNNQESISWLHHPLLTDTTGKKLGKSEGSAAIRELRSAGKAAPDVIGLALHKAGIINQPLPVKPEELSHYLQSK